MTCTKSNILQYNVYPPKPKRRREYYPFGLQTANSWTRENVTGNNFLYNGGTELNTTTNVYDLYFRNYDPALGRMNQIDPMASKYASLTPYNYSFNNPVGYNDPSGAEPPQTINHSAFYNQYYTYDDRVDYTGMGDPVCGHCWRTGNSLTLYQRFTGYSTLSMGVDWRPGQSGLTPIISQWAPDFGGPVYLGLDTNGNSIHALPSQIERAGGARAYFNQVYNYRLGMAAFNMVQRPLVKDEGYSGFFPVVNGRLDLANAEFYRWSKEIDLKNIFASARGQQQTQTGPCPPGTPCDGPWLKNSSDFNPPANNNPEGLSTSFVLGTGFTAGKTVATKAQLEILKQIRINNSLRKSGIQFDGPLKVPNGVKFVAKYGGYGFTAYDAFSTNDKWIDGKISTPQMLIQQTSNAISAIPYMGIGTAWSLGWNLGASYGPSTWFGTDDTKWFK